MWSQCCTPDARSFTLPRTVGAARTEVSPPLVSTLVRTYRATRYFPAPTHTKLGTAATHSIWPMLCPDQRLPALYCGYERKFYPYVKYRPGRGFVTHHAKTVAKTPARVSTQQDWGIKYDIKTYPSHIVRILSGLPRDASKGDPGGDLDLHRRQQRRV